LAGGPAVTKTIYLGSLYLFYITLHCRQKRTESWSQATCTENFVKFGRVVFETAKLCGVEQRAPPMFGRATITLGIGPNSSCRCFQDGGRPPSYLLCVCLDHPRRAFGGLYRCAKFGLNRCSSFDNMHVLSISRVWLENAYSRPQNCFF